MTEFVTPDPEIYARMLALVEVAADFRFKGPMAIEARAIMRLVKQAEAERQWWNQADHYNG